jgi:hypothetical protein
VGTELVQICFSANQLTLHFGIELGISIQSSLSFKRFGVDIEPRLLSLPICESDLMVVVGDCVVQAASNSEGTLFLSFVGGHEIAVFDDSYTYESYQIRMGNKVIIV